MAPSLHLGFGGRSAGLGTLLCQQEGDLLRQLLGSMHGHRLVSSQLAAHYLDLPLGHLELFGQVLDEVTIGLAIDLRGCDGDFQLVAMYPLDLVATGLWLDKQIQPKRISLLAHGYHEVRFHNGLIQPLVERKIFTACKNRNSTSTERSSPPKGGMMRRIGASIGSVNCSST